MIARLRKLPPRRSGAALIGGLILAMAPPPAAAHLMQTGFGGFYDGLTHLVLTPGDLLLVLALTVLAAQNGAATSRALLFSLPCAWLVGGVIGLRQSGEPSLDLLTTLSFALVGLLAALRLQLGVAGIVILATITGTLHGLVNGLAMNHGGGEALALIGAVTGVFVFVAITGAQLSQLRAAWTAIALRVVGSWIAAAGLLMLGWLARRAHEHASGVQIGPI